MLADMDAFSPAVMKPSCIARPKGTARVSRSGSAQHPCAMLRSTTGLKGNLPDRLHIGASPPSLAALRVGWNPTDPRRRAPGSRRALFQPADLRPEHAGSGQIPSGGRKNPSPCPPIGVQLRVAKSNYHQVRRQKELVRKTRQQEKQQKRLAAKSTEPAADGTDPVSASGESVAAVADGTSAS